MTLLSLNALFHEDNHARNLIIVMTDSTLGRKSVLARSNYENKTNIHALGTELDFAEKRARVV
jgi:hypothetical protein